MDGGDYDVDSWIYCWAVRCVPTIMMALLSGRMTSRNFDNRDCSGDNDDCSIGVGIIMC